VAVRESSFAESLPYHQRRLASRLEGFGDIVFGFAVSQCALQLPTNRGHVEIARPLGLLMYFATFALLASLWLIYHRLMSSAFRPAGLDLLLAFSYLAFVSLMPFALYSMSHDTQGLESARAALAAYAALYAIMTAIATTLTFRNMRRGWYGFEDEERDRTWRTLTRQSVVCAFMLLALTIDLAFGPNWAGPVFFGLFPAFVILRRRFRHAPAATVFRISAPARTETAG
jgi:uncharacterized membrane protein